MSEPNVEAISAAKAAEMQKEIDKYKADAEANARRADEATAIAQKAIDDRINAAAEAFVASLVHAGKDSVATPAERAQIKAAFATAARDDMSNPVAGSPDFRQDALRAAYKSRKPHGLTVERGGSDPADLTRALGSDPADEPQDPAAQKEKDAKATARKEANRKYAESLNGTPANA